MDEEAVVITPALEPISLIVRSITSRLQNDNASQEELSVVMRFIAKMLRSLDSDYQSGVSTPERDSDVINRLTNLMNRFAGFVEKEAANTSFKSLISRRDRIVTLEKYEEEIEEVVALFELSIESDLLQNLAHEARQVDEAVLAVLLTEMESNSTYKDMFNVPKEQQLSMIIALQNQLSLGCSIEETRFFSHSVQYLKGITGDSKDLENWTITKYDVELGSTIKSGLSGDVYSGKMGETDVVVKVMKNGTVTPKISILRRVAGRLPQLDHIHVLKFIGANLSSDYPFFVTPFLRNSNALNYIHDHPRCDLTKILHEASLGLEYLHSQKFVHGNVKATNILIDDNGRAVLCNYGLAKIRRNFNLRLLSSVHLSSSTQNWMAPELFSGAEPNKSSDVYSFGMTIYEVFSQKQPFADISGDTLRDSVLGNGRPTRPSAEQAPRLSDEMWLLTQRCWHREPAQRPKSSILSRDLGHIHQKTHMHLRSISQPQPPSNLDGAARGTSGKSHVASLESTMETNITINPQPAMTVPPTISNAYTRCLILRHKTPATHLALYPKGNKAIVTQKGGTIILWDVIKGLELHTYESKQDIRTVLPPMPRQTAYKWFITGSANGDITLWGGSLLSSKPEMLCSTKIGVVQVGQPIRAEVGQPIQQLEWHPDIRGVHSFATSSNLTTDTCDIYDSQLQRADNGRYYFSYAKRRPVPGISTSPTCSAFLHQGKCLVTGDATGTLSFWETETGQQFRTTLEYTPNDSVGQSSLSGGCISIITPLSDSTIFAVAYSTTEIRLWDSSSWTYQTVRPPEINATTGPCRSLPLALSSDGSWILFPSFSSPKCIEVYDRMSGITTISYKLKDWPDGGNVHTMILTPDKTRLLLSFEGYSNVLVFCWVPQAQKASKSTWLSKLF